MDSSDTNLSQKQFDVGILSSCLQQLLHHWDIASVVYIVTRASQTVNCISSSSSGSGAGVSALAR